MEITLTRIAKKDGYTIGRLAIGGQYFCDTLEPQWRHGSDGGCRCCWGCHGSAA